MIRFISFFIKTSAVGLGVWFTLAFAPVLVLADAPVPTSVSPSMGPTTGGAIVTINGIFFEPGTRVQFNGVEAESVRVLSWSQLQVLTPAGRGISNIVVINSDGSSGQLSNAYEFIDPPGAFTVTPNSGTLGTVVTIRGSNFRSPIRVSFGGQAGFVSSESSNELIVGVPSNALGPTYVRVINPDGQSTTLEGGFTYLDLPAVPPPTLLSISPMSGPAVGGTAVTLVGSNFATGAIVRFNGSLAASVTFVNSTKLIAVTPESAGTVDVTVTNRDGQFAILSNAFQFMDPPPVIQYVSPNSGPASGGTVLSISAIGMLEQATVRIGGIKAAKIYHTGGVFEILSPPNTAGAKDVVVTNPDGQSGTLSNGFTYIASPAPTVTISKITPNSGTTPGGYSVTVTGSGFIPGAVLMIGRWNAFRTVVVSATQLTADAPSGALGPADVILFNGDGTHAALVDGFTYVPNPPPPALSISQVSPGSGLTTGGTSVTITGTGFVSGTTVRMGGASATSVVVVSATQITAVTPPGTAGFNDIIVTNADGQSATLTNGFNYFPPNLPPAPIVDLADPNFGPPSGGTFVNLTGKNFATGAIVKFGTKNATLMNLLNSTAISVVAPAGPDGQIVSLSVTNPDGQVGFVSQGFLYNRKLQPAPTIVSLSPNAGPVAGGTPITVTGTNFLYGATLKIGGVSALSVVVQSPTQLNALAPAGTAGAKDIVLTNPDGQSATLVSGFTYNAPPPPPPAPAPTISMITPNSGPTSGGTSVTISGTGFVSGATLKVGGANTLSVVVVSATEITAVTPAGTVGSKDVVLTNPDGQSATLVSGFTYNAPPPPPPAPAPTISMITPNSGPTSGGTSVTISGTGFVSGATLKVGGAAALSVSVVSATEITAVTPAGTVGSKDVVLTNPDGPSATLSGGFTYNAPPPPPPLPAPTISEVKPNTGPTAGGTLVIITGNNFNSGATVRIGGISATSVVVLSATEMTAVSPASIAGAKDVIVTNPDGQQAALSSAFKYVDPVAQVPDAPVQAPPSALPSKAVFNPNTGAQGEIRYRLDQSEHVRIVIYDRFGTEVRTLIDETRAAGTYSDFWSGRNGASQMVASGFYNVLLQVGDHSEKLKLVVIK